MLGQLAELLHETIEALRARSHFWTPLCSIFQACALPPPSDARTINSQLTSAHPPLCHCPRDQHHLGVVKLYLRAMVLA